MRYARLQMIYLHGTRVGRFVAGEGFADRSECPRKKMAPETGAMNKS